MRKENVMEKNISVEERIKRAEERYYNTLNRDYNNIKDEVNVQSNKNNITERTNKKRTLKRKVLTQIFSNDMKQKTKEILNTDINFSQIYSNLKCNIEKFFQNIQTNNNEQNSTESTDNTEKNEETSINDIQNNDENIGGAIEDVDLQIGDTSEIEEIQKQNNEEINENIEQENNEVIELSQMEQDANFVKENISIIKPINGTISSRYGLRNPTTVTVPKNHTGIDLAETTGTKIVSATDGTVILNSSKGDYGNHLKIQNGDATFIYAHCSKLYVNEGDIIQQGQEIAEVGATGNATGPHLHFEIRYQNRLIDPELILEF
mgnify:CR=1 FL=1